MLFDVGVKDSGIGYLFRGRLSIFLSTNLRETIDEVKEMGFDPSKIKNAATAREAWSILVRRHAGGDKIRKVKLQTLRRQYEHLQMDEGEKVSEYFNKVLTTSNQMKRCSETIIDLMVIEKIMRSLPQKFDHIVVAIEESRDLERLKIEELQSALEAHEMRMSERNYVQIDEQALKVHHIKNDEKKNLKKWKEKKNKFEKGWKKKDKRNIECFNCHKLGHFAYECFSEKANRRKDFKVKKLTLRKKNQTQSH
ncbi:uncharacterized protein LOC124820640 [Vigna umbellata]|uniref:uncharacterized protein LOC124820640 n=1 Tax=Vigna umbellata TaxID=87088 RepID=UPI001F5F3E32|nr:uncharacterized protein LOC124820640 [Vigna umbellata]